jgi:hypothetical protein
LNVFFVTIEALLCASSAAGSINDLRVWICFVMSISVKRKAENT